MNALEKANQQNAAKRKERQDTIDYCNAELAAGTPDPFNVLKNMRQHAENDIRFYENLFRSNWVRK